MIIVEYMLLQEDNVSFESNVFDDMDKAMWWYNHLCDKMLGEFVKHFGPAYEYIEATGEKIGSGPVMYSRGAERINFEVSAEESDITVFGEIRLYERIVNLPNNGVAFRIY